VIGYTPNPLSGLDEILEVRKGLIIWVAYKGGKDIQHSSQNAALFVDLL
jgi:hypothetical protein